MGVEVLYVRIRVVRDLVVPACGLKEVAKVTRRRGREWVAKGFATNSKSLHDAMSSEQANLDCIYTRYFQTRMGNC